MIETKYSLTYVASYDDDHCWQIREFSYDHYEQIKQMKRCVQGLFNSADWVNPELSQKGYSIFTNSDYCCLNLRPAFMTERNGKQILVEGNVLFLKNNNGKPAGLSVEDLTAIINSYYPELKNVELICCPKTLKEELALNKNIIETDKDRI